jgi:RNA polymerase sigma-70 factor (ECF subfamily)
LDLPELVAQHQTNLFAFLYRMCGDTHLAEDLTQEVFVRAIRAAGRYEPRGKVTTWLFSIAANVVKDHWRRQTRARVVHEEEFGPASGAPAEEEALLGLELEQVRQALLQLPVEQRTALVLRYYHDFSYADIAQAMVCPVGTVRSRIHNGLERLKQVLTAEVQSHGRTGTAP